MRPKIQFFRPLDQAAFTEWHEYVEGTPPGQPMVGDLVWLALPDSEKRKDEPPNTTYGFKVYKRHWTTPWALRVYVEETAIV